MGLSTYEAESRGPDTRIEYKNDIVVQQVPSRHEHLKMAAWGRNMLWKRESELIENNVAYWRT
jgi:hypothetical protein